MVDNTTRLLADYVSELRYEYLSDEAIRETKRHLVDTIGCAVGGYRSQPATIARRIAEKVSGQPPASILGAGSLTSPEMATFANSTMVRYLDYNDSYISLGSGHPSDMVPACLAVAEAYGASGEETLLAIVAAYEVFAALADVIQLRERGWDQGIFAVLGSTAGAGKLIGLSSGQLAEALSIAVTSNVPTRQTRAGDLSMWKGSATASAARAGVFAATLAREGMTGPTAAFEGKHGLWDQVTGPFQLGPLGATGEPLGIERTHLKFFPSEFHAQVPLSMALNFRQQVSIAEIDSLEVQIYYMAYSEIGSEPAKWEPKTRETADHSLPFLLASALTDGSITPASFNEERLADPALRSLMQRIKISENPEFTRQFPAALVSRIDLRTVDGRHLVEEGAYPRGHVKNPMRDDEVETKFRQVSQGLLSLEAQTLILGAVGHLEDAKTIGSVLDLIRVGA